MTYKMIVADLDETLISRDRSICLRTQRSLCRERQGVTASRRLRNFCRTVR